MSIAFCSKKIGRFSAITVVALAAVLATQGTAQTTDSLMLAHPEYTASGYAIYPEPGKDVKYTKAPQGYKPFYISHYGRHGSRYHYSADDYKYIYETFAKADTAKALSVTGKYVMAAAKLLMTKAADHAGDLTQIGVRQQEGIANRMAKNFPEVFKEHKEKGKTVPPHVDAYASTSGRCILSMSAFLGELRAQKPKTEIYEETGKSLMGFINNFNFDITKDYGNIPEFKAENDKIWKNVSTRNFVQTLFIDTAYVSRNIDINNFYTKMFEIVGSLQDMEEDDRLIILERLLTKEERLNRWKAQNAWWYSILGTCPLTGDAGINTAKPILKHILDEADKAIEGSNTVATLRFGHDTGILPLASLMQLSVASAKVTDLSKLHEQWTDFKIIPMAANLQMVFYKKPNSKPAKNASATGSGDVIVKFLYNEREVTVPVPCGYDPAASALKPGMAMQAMATPGVMLPANKVKCPAEPYYRWDDVRNFYRAIAE